MIQLLKVKFRRILVGIDVNNESKQVADQALSIAKNNSSELHAITVFDVPDIYTSQINPDKLSHQNIKERVKKMEHRLLEIKKNAEREGLSVITKLLDENMRPEKSLLSYCKNNDIDLIIVGKGKGKGESIVGDPALIKSSMLLYYQGKI
jgi:nucleotide-binding universal stress UspA family protein